MSGNKERLDDFVEIKGGTVTFGGGEGKITGKGTIITSKLDFENVADLLTKAFDGPRFNYLVLKSGNNQLAAAQECGALESADVYVSSLHSQHHAHMCFCCFLMMVKCFAAVPSQVLILKAKIYLET
ncbi:hypothetical protein Tco_1305083 [Tanacetum coccineum]